MAVAAFDRAAALERLAHEQFDVLVVGGGITGAGVALDAASRGLRTALVEARDFASGTSSRSSKFVHGGLRYLKQRQFRLVLESLSEQRRLLRNAPHLVRPVPVRLLVELHQPRRALTGALLAAHDLAGGTGWRREPGGSSLVFHEAQVDDARLTLAVLRTAVLDHAAVAVNHCRFSAFERGRAVLDDGAVTVSARVVVNATGVWSGSGVRPAKGVHLVVGRDKVPFDTAVTLPVPGDRRWVFLAPWEDRTLVGTTDTAYDGPLEDPPCTPEDVAGLLEAVNSVLPAPLTPDDVLASWAGLRPLVADDPDQDTADLSRRHRVTTSPDGVVTVVGGKLTTYRRMAADAVDATGLARRRSRTARLRLRGAGESRPALPPHLWHRYGTEGTALAKLAEADPALAAPLVPGLPYLRAEAVWAVRHEMARDLDDVLSRRTRAAFLDEKATAQAAPKVAKLLAPELGWTAAETERQVDAFSSRPAWAWRR